MPNTSKKQLRSASILLGLAWARSRTARSCASIIAAVLALIVVTFVSVSSLSLTNEQLGQKQYGIAIADTYTSVDVGDMRPGVIKETESRISRIAPNTRIMIETDAVRPDRLAKRFVQAPLKVLRYVEDSDLLAGFPDRFSLISGVWPASPSEVVVSQTLYESLSEARRFTVLSGRTTFTVVGVAVDAYATKSEIIIAAPGTWEAIPPAEPGRVSIGTTANIRILFEGAGPSDDVLSRIARNVSQTLPAVPVELGNRESDVKANIVTRSQFVTSPEATFAADQLAVSWYPLALIIMIAAGFVVAQFRAWQTLSLKLTRNLGVSTPRVILTQSFALATASTAALVAGVLTGLIASLILRRWFLPELAEQPLAPFPALGLPVSILSLICIVIIVLGSCARLRSSAAPSIRPRMSPRSWRPNSAHVRRVLVILLAVGFLRVRGEQPPGEQQTSALPVYLVVGGCVLLAPDIYRIVISALPSRFPVAWVAQRLMRADIFRQSAAVVLVASCVAAPVLIGSQLASQRESDASFTYARVPLGQLWVQSDSAIGDVAGAARVVSNATRIDNPVVVRSLRSDDNSEAAIFFEDPTYGTSSYNVIVVDTAEDVARLVDTNLPADAPAVLMDGGVVDFSRTTGDQKFIITDANGDLVKDTPNLPTVHAKLSIEFRANYGGAILRSTATELGLPVSKPVRYVFPSVSSDEVETAAAAAVQAGFDSDFVQYAVEPPPPDLPIYAYIFLTALTSGGCLLVLIVIRDRGRLMQAYAARLLAIGLTRSWIAATLYIQTTLLVVVGMASGVVAGSVGASALRTEYAVRVVPYAPITVVCASVAIVAILTTAVAVQRLRAAAPVNES